MMAMISFMTMYLNHISSLDIVLTNLLRKEEVFILESKLILNVKCELLNSGDEFKSFYLDGALVDVSIINGGYRLIWGEIIVDISVNENKIYDYELIAFDK